MSSVRTIVVTEPVYQYALYLTERYMQGGVSTKELSPLNDWWNSLTAAGALECGDSDSLQEATDAQETPGKIQIPARVKVGPGPSLDSLLEESRGE